MSQNVSNQIESSEGKKEEGSEIVSNVNKTSENENNHQQENEQSQKENNNNGNMIDAQAGNNYDYYEKNKKEIMEKIEMRKQQAEYVEKYINETGIGTAFQIIFSELISKKIPVEDYYKYTAGRLRQIGKEKEALDRRNNKK